METQQTLTSDNGNLDTHLLALAYKEIDILKQEIRQLKNIKFDLNEELDRIREGVLYCMNTLEEIA